MFRGFNNVSLDSKGRIAIPTRYRERLSILAEGHLVLTMNPLDLCLWLYPLKEWESIEQKLAALSDFDLQNRRTKQMMRGYANDCQLDAQGRILVPQELRDYAALDRQAVILGQGNKFEIWNQRRWEEQRDKWLAQVGSEDASSAQTMQSLSL